MLTWRVVTGVLKGFDQLMNLVLDDVKEITSGERKLPAFRD
jgi:small nuclear ribonucleoprotein (snRNP)-like protein